VPVYRILYGPAQKNPDIRILCEKISRKSGATALTPDTLPMGAPSAWWPRAPKAR